VSPGAAARGAGEEPFLVVHGHAAVTRGGVSLGVLNAGYLLGEMAMLGTAAALVNCGRSSR
jgi:hypothetical protein